MGHSKASHVRTPAERDSAANRTETRKVRNRKHNERNEIANKKAGTSFADKRQAANKARTPKNVARDDLGFIIRNTDEGIRLEYPGKRTIEQYLGKGKK